MFVCNHHSLEELKDLKRHTRCSEIRQRLQIIILAKELKTSHEIARELGFARSTCLVWVSRYNKEQLSGLESRHPKGKKKALSPEEENLFRMRVEAGPTKEDKVCAFRGKDIQSILAKEFNKVRSLSSVYYLLHQLGYSLLSPRPRHPKSNSEEQELFKKKLKKRLTRLKRHMLVKR